MPYYTAKNKCHRKIKCYNSDTHERIDYVSWADTDNSKIGKYLLDLDRPGCILKDKNGLVVVVENRNIYVKHMITEQINPPTGDFPKKGS